MHGKCRDRPLKVLAAADSKGATTRQTRPPAKRAKRSVIFNACEGCRSRKIKVSCSAGQGATISVELVDLHICPCQCSGETPCERCVLNQIECVYLGRAHERTPRDLDESQHNLASIQQELLLSQQQLADSQQANFDLQRDLTASQLDLLQCRQQSSNHQGFVNDIYDFLRTPGAFAGAYLSSTAQQSGATSEFVNKVTSLLDSVTQERDSDDPALLC